MTAANPTQWGDRRELLEKHLSYAFSLDVQLELGTPFLSQALAPVCWPPRSAEGEYATHREIKKCQSIGTASYRIPGTGDLIASDGTMPDTPQLRLLHADDNIVLSNRITGSLAGRFVFETDTPSLLGLAYTGVVNFKGWPSDLVSRDAKKSEALEERFGKVEGKAYVASRQEVDSPKYRWLVYNQLIGIARIAPARTKEGALRWVGGKENQDGEGLLLAFNFDFYIGS